MSPVIAELTDLFGDDLVQALERRFDTSVADVTTGDRTLSILGLATPTISFARRIS